MIIIIIIIINIIFVIVFLWEFFTPTLADGIPLELSEQVPTSLLDSSLYSGRS